jgi:hypothetical protein
VVTLEVGGQSLSFVPPVDELREAQIEGQRISNAAQAEALKNARTARSTQEVQNRMLDAIFSGGDELDNRDAIVEAVARGDMPLNVGNFLLENLDKGEDPTTSNMVRAATTVVRDASDALYLLGDKNVAPSAEARQLSRIPTSGIMANSMVRVAKSKVIGTPEYEVGKFIQSVKDNIGIDALLNIKREGSGLGAVPQQQLETLQGLLGRLDIGRDINILQRDIRDINNIYKDIVKKAGGEIGTFNTQTMQDGSVWQENTDGTYTRIK